MTVALLLGLKSFISTNVPSAGDAYPNEVPQNKSGWSYFIVSDTGEIGHSGALNFFRARIQVDLQYASTATKGSYQVAHDVADAMRAALDGYKGAMGSAKIKFCKTEMTDDWADVSEVPTIRFDILINYTL